MQEKFGRLFMSIASELWLRGVIETVVISGILAGGIPGFRIELCCLHPLKWPIVILWLVLLLFNFMGLRQHGTQVVICMRREDIKLSPLASIDLFHP